MGRAMDRLADEDLLALFKTLPFCPFDSDSPDRLEFPAVARETSVVRNAIHAS
jgi:hypothetical protein